MKNTRVPNGASSAHPTRQAIVPSAHGAAAAAICMVDGGASNSPRRTWQTHFHARPAARIRLNGQVRANRADALFDR